MSTVPTITSETGIVGVQIEHWQRSAKLKAIVEATFPNYKRRRIMLRPDTEVTFHQLGWDGGSRNEYRACIVNGDTVRPFAYLAAIGEGVTLPIPPNVVIVKGGTFCGKQATLYLHVNAADMAQALAVQS